DVFRVQQHVRDGLGPGAIADHRRPDAAWSRADLLLRAERREWRGRKTVGVGYGRGSLRRRPVAAGLVRVLVLRVALRAIRRDLRRARRSDGPDAVALPDRSGDSGRR